MPETKQKSVRRNAPKQDRSRETIKKILRATVEVLATDGIFGVNTNRISAVSGVTVGSIYQYYRNKEAILFELYRKHADAVLSGFEACLEELKPTDRPEQLFVDAMMTFFLTPEITAHRIHVEFDIARQIYPEFQALHEDNGRRLVQILITQTARKKPDAILSFDYTATQFMNEFSHAISVMGSQAIIDGDRQRLTYLTEALEAATQKFFAPHTEVAQSASGPSAS